jgi:hypothetical protein
MSFRGCHRLVHSSLIELLARRLPRKANQGSKRRAGRDLFDTYYNTPPKGREDLARRVRRDCVAARGFVRVLRV